MTNTVSVTTPSISAPVPALRCKNMFAIASGKGGVGKTWFSITLCHTLAKRGKQVLLFDGDLGLANVDIQLGLTPEKDLASVLDGSATMKEAILKYEDGGFDVLAGRSGAGNLATLGSQKVTELRNDLLALADSYDYVAVDLSAGVDRSVRQLAGPAAVTFVVITDEPTSLTDAYAFIKLGRAANPSGEFRIVVNMAANVNEGQKTYETIKRAAESFLDYTPPLMGIVRRDPKVRDTIRAQTPLLIRSPNSDAANDVEAIVRRLLEN